MASQKRCPRCCTEKDTTEFSKDKYTLDNLCVYCRKCCKDIKDERKLRVNNRCECGKLLAPYGTYCHKCKYKGDRSPRWQGGRNLTTQGYISLSGMYDHPNAFADGSLKEHVKVMSDHLGRPLLTGENVHHKNGVRDDNRIENLELWSSSQPKGQRIEDKVEYAFEILRTYRPEMGL